jgi:hypothetical protein
MVGRTPDRGRDSGKPHQEPFMDLVRSELLPPVLISDMQREAQRQALASLAVRHHGRRGPAFLTRLGAALVRAGCRMQIAGQRLMAVSPLVAPSPCGRGA